MKKGGEKEEEKGETEEEEEEVEGLGRRLPAR